VIAQPNLNISIIKPDAVPDSDALIKMPPASGLLMLSQADFAGRKYRVRLHACRNPTCECCSVRFDCEPVDAPYAGSGVIHWFWLDVLKKAVEKSDALISDPATKRLANAIRSELTPADWQTLYLWFRIHKQEVIAETTPEEFDMERLPNVEPGAMVGFTEVFPWGRALDFALGDEFWTVEEQYCVEAKCDCTEAVLCFLKYRDSDAKEIVGPNNPPTLRYDYCSRKVTKTLHWLETLPAPKELMKLIAQSEPSLHPGMELRHTLVKTLYIQRRVNQLKDLLPARSSKTGRNSPCRCGSGKKYKHCCLGKSSAA
jgi:hypothetical protein